MEATPGAAARLLSAKLFRSAQQHMDPVMAILSGPLCCPSSITIEASNMGSWAFRHRTLSCLFPDKVQRPRYLRTYMNIVGLCFGTSARRRTLHFGYWQCEELDSFFSDYSHSLAIALNRFLSTDFVIQLGLESKYNTWRRATRRYSFQRLGEARTYATFQPLGC